MTPAWTATAQRCCGSARPDDEMKDRAEGGSIRCESIRLEQRWGALLGRAPKYPLLQEKLSRSLGSVVRAMTTVFASRPTPRTAALRGGAHERVFRRRTRVHTEAIIRLAAQRLVARDGLPHRPGLRGHFKLHRRNCSSGSGGVRHGGGRSGSVGSFACPSSFLMVLRSMINASRRSRPPHCGQANTSIPNPRRMSSAHCRRRCRGRCRVGGSCSSEHALFSGAAAGRPYSTTRGLHAAFALSTPW
jgi:hypothetical protein